MSDGAKWHWIDVDGRRLETAVVRDGRGRRLQLRVDGEVVDDKSSTWSKTVLRCDDGTGVEVEPVHPGRISAARLVPPEDDTSSDDLSELLQDRRASRLRPPRGTVGARLDDYADAHPWFVVVRHVGGSGAGVLLSVLGIGALLRALLPRFDVDLSPPDWLPSIDLSWIPDPFGWLWGLLPDWDLPDLDAPGWVDALVSSWKWWGPVAIALFVALGEVDRRRKRAERDAAHARHDPSDPGTTPRR
ncbi:hypothetical protein [Solicola sp. PLA-1-18]|uniref:hypothetical protein n=1 Tax=Solicola sp. PLA-1-18 TaxID=3380532 RepID=UPI003B766381